MYVCVCRYEYVGVRLATDGDDMMLPVVLIYLYVLYMRFKSIHNYDVIVYIDVAMHISH